jgi:hypothetical protein
MHTPPVAHDAGAIVVVVVVGATVVVVVGATVVVVAATVAAERIHVCRLPEAHALVTDQRNTPVLPSAHNNKTLLTGTARNGAAQPDAAATDTNRVLSLGFIDEASQHNKGADFDADQICLPPTQLALEVTRLATPDEASTHTATALGKRLASATPPAHNTPANNATAIPARPNRFITLSCPETTGHGGVRGMPHRLSDLYNNFKHSLLSETLVSSVNTWSK